MNEIEQILLAAEVNVFDLIIGLFKDSRKESFTPAEASAAVEHVKNMHVRRVNGK